MTVVAQQVAADIDVGVRKVLACEGALAGTLQADQQHEVHHASISHEDSPKAHTAGHAARCMRTMYSTGLGKRQPLARRLGPTIAYVCVDIYEEASDGECEATKPSQLADCRFGDRRWLGSAGAR